ncbi:MAG TPA: endolytic transglycosylase MltG [Solirubrobacteraceae bacterium]|nr:endolytic transglycosylase MltG [Solirubrobacteraceae bacterium]
MPPPEAPLADAVPPPPPDDPADPLGFEEPPHLEAPDEQPFAEPLPPADPDGLEPPALHEHPDLEPTAEPAGYEPLAEGHDEADLTPAVEPSPAEPIASEPPALEAAPAEPPTHEPGAVDPQAEEHPATERHDEGLHASEQHPEGLHAPEQHPEELHAPEQHPEEPSQEEPLPSEPSQEEPPAPEPPLEEPPAPEPVVLDRPAEARGRVRRGRHVDDPEATQGYEIPGLPPDDPAPAPSKGLPEPPPRVGPTGAAPARRAFARGEAGGLGAVGPPRERRRRGVGSRLAALVALAAVAVAVVLLVHSLKGSSKTKAPLAVPVIKVLIPEGKTRLQIAQIAKAAGLKGSYRTAARRSVLLNPVTFGAPKGTPDLEGFLFPATYDMNKGAPVSRLVEEQLTAFRENFGAEDASRAKALGVTPYGLLTIASMIEREAQIPGDRAKIAAVIYNRLKAGMPLGIDAAIYYAVEVSKNIPTYTGELTESQLQIHSAYNTRTHTGLPPTPISNPGVASIQAAAHPAHASYLYYVAGADGCGEQVFSTTQAAFETNVAAYEEAKRKNGGKPPTCKKKH